MVSFKCTQNPLSYVSGKMPSTEVIFNTIVKGLYNEKLMPYGSVLDVGAYLGIWTEFYAEVSGSKVYSIDPSQYNIRRIKHKKLNNVCTLWGGVSSTSRPAKTQQNDKKSKLSQC